MKSLPFLFGLFLGVQQCWTNTRIWRKKHMDNHSVMRKIKCQSGMPEYSILQSIEKFYSIELILRRYEILYIRRSPWPLNYHPFQNWDLTSQMRECDRCGVTSLCDVFRRKTRSFYLICGERGPSMPLALFGSWNWYSRNRDLQISNFGRKNILLSRKRKHWVHKLWPWTPGAGPDWVPAIW